jgi:hypothetical protein
MCSERMHLLVDYQDATHIYADSVRYLTESVAPGLEDPDALRRACRQAWENAEKTRAALVRHKGCEFCRRMRLAS